MVFTSYIFPVFLLTTILVYFIFPIKFRWVVLLIASVVFYLWAGIKYLPIILLTALVSYLAALLISKKNDYVDSLVTNNCDKETVKRERLRAKHHNRAVVLVSLFVVIGYLAYTKFGNMVFDSLSAIGFEKPAIMVIVPLGISYYTFSSVGYVLDVYWKRYRAETNFFKYFLFLSYFPHILQGPIARYDRLGIQFSQEHSFDYNRVSFGLQLMLFGYFQKLVIADRVGVFVKQVYDDCYNQYGYILLIATLFYAVQIYADFAGCINIARGISQVFGIEIEENFRQPYFSKSVEEYWRRWHITLGAWFKDYLCMPVSTMKIVKEASKKSRKRWGSQAGRNVITITSLIAVWICTGIWHGTGLNYIIWAAWQCGIIVLSILMEKPFSLAKTRLKIDDESSGWKVFQIIRTFILTGIIPRVITRANSLDDAKIIFKNMLLHLDNFWVFFDDSLYNYGLNRKNVTVGIISILIMFFVSLSKEKGVSIRETIAKQGIVFRWIIYMTAVMTVVVFGVYGTEYNASSFIYMGF